ncbi:MAG: hypothetical protein PVH88_21285 [Ignavibacteria bacterium]|jgi:hypothetical protein
MNKELIELKDTIVSAIRGEDLQLFDLHKKGIFFIPELAVTYLVGRAIVKNSYQIFGEEVKNWIAEHRIQDDVGPNDLILTLESNVKVVFEFKTRPKDIYRYLKDIEKLSKINDDNVIKIFCGLMEYVSGTEYNDDFIKMFEDKAKVPLHRIVEDNKFFDYFTTKDHAIQNYDKQMCCVVGLWKVE